MRSLNTLSIYDKPNCPDGPAAKFMGTITGPATVIKVGWPATTCANAVPSVFYLPIIYQGSVAFLEFNPSQISPTSSTGGSMPL